MEKTYTVSVSWSRMAPYLPYDRYRWEPWAKLVARWICFWHPTAAVHVTEVK